MAATRKSTRKSTRKDRKKSRKAPNAWNQAVMRVYKELKSKNRDAKFGDALREASKRKKSGNL